MVTYNSVGDIISVSLLVKDLLIAINSSRGAAAEYQEVVQELYVLDKALLQVESFAKAHQTTPEVFALCEIAQRSVEKSKTCVDSFIQRIKKYGASLSSASSGNAFKRAARSVQWQLSRDDLDRFRAEIMSHSNAIQMLLATAQVGLMKVDNEDLKKRITDSNSAAQASYDAQSTVLAEIRDKIKENKRLITDGNAMKVQMLQRWGWLKNLGCDIRTFMRSIMQTNVNIFSEVVFIRRRLATIPVWSLAEEPFVLEDAIGRRAPVHLRFITSWKAFESVIENRFEGRRGHSKVRKREYVLLEDGTAQEIDRTQDWDLAVMPGQFITMSMVFKEDRAVETGSHNENACCPYCQTRTESASSSNVQCSKCRKWFSRLVDLDDDADPDLVVDVQRQPEMPMADNDAVFQLPEQPRGLKRPADVDLDDDSDMTAFMRVRVLVRQKKQKFAHDFGNGESTIPLVPVDTYIPNYDRTPGYACTSSWRVKVYELKDNDWYDRGTGYCTGEGFKEQFATALHHSLIVRSEDDSGIILLDTRVEWDAAHQKQQDTLIVWTEPNGVDMALSFQEAEGCAEIWYFISENADYPSD